jgi:hypothetical protein
MNGPQMEFIEVVKQIIKRHKIEQAVVNTGSKRLIGHCLPRAVEILGDDWLFTTARGR